MKRAATNQDIQKAMLDFIGKYPSSSDALRELPENIKLVVDLTEEEYQELLPPEMWNMKYIEFNTNAGIRVYPRKIES